MHRKAKTVALFLLFWTSQVFSLSANFPPSAVQCSEFAVRFSGPASPPFTLLLLPATFSSPEIIPIPEDAWDNTTSQGSFNASLSFPTGTEFISVLHDNGGRGTGVVSDLYIVEPNQGTSPEGCARQPQPSENIFTLTPSPPTQCDVQALSWDPSRLNTRFGGRRPSGAFLNQLNFTSYIPGGQAFRLDPINTAGPTSQAIWLVNVAAGLRYISLLEYYDRDGAPIRETSSLQQVQSPTDGNADCLGPDSPTTTVASSPSAGVANIVASSQSSLVPMTTADPNTGEQVAGSTGFFNNTQNIAILAGGSSGALLLIVAIGCFVCYRRRRRRSQDEEINNSAIKVNLDVLEPASFNETKSGETRSKTPEDDGLAPLPTIEKLHKRNPTRRTPRVHRYISSIASWGNLGPLPA
ncbi:hypothetical protein FRC18_011122 [Serendipita sp. 400]|nr:hypothetical protein FRC18_011122 [Serendipita sp. 400]